MKFLESVYKTPKISNVMKIHPLGAESFYEDEQTDRQTDRHD